MTPVALLVAFCAVMAAIAVARVTTGDERDPVDVAVALIVAGSTALSLLWVTITESWTTSIARFGFAVIGTALVVSGAVLLFRSLSRSPGSPS